MAEKELDQEGIDNIKKQIIWQVGKYYKMWDIPLAFEVLARSFNPKHEGYKGGMKNLMIEMDIEGQVTIEKTPKGKLVVFPFEAAKELENEGRISDKLSAHDLSPALKRGFKGSKANV